MSDLQLAVLVQDAADRMQASGLFFGHGTDNALDEACWLASYVFDLPPDFGSEAFSLVVAESDRRRFDEVLRRRIETRQPLAYLIGEAWFAGLRFGVNNAVLVPRSPLAELILEGFEPWLPASRLRRAVDVGTGSGCIAIALAHYYPEVEVDAVDVSEDALLLATENVQEHGLTERVRLIRSDLLEAVSDQSYDLILANPPYVPEASMKALPQEFAWEPRLGLVAGKDGLALVRRLIVQAADRLSPEGVLICEVGEAAAALDDWLADEPLTWLEFAQGGDGVFLLDRETCRRIAMAGQEIKD